MEQRARRLLIELIDLCRNSNHQQLRIIRRYGEYIRATAGHSGEKGCIRSHSIEDADYQAILAFFGLDLDPTKSESVDIVIAGSSTTITPTLQKYHQGQTLTLSLAYPSAESN